jgi:hypothetical protein
MEELIMLSIDARSARGSRRGSDRFIEPMSTRATVMWPKSLDTGQTEIVAEHFQHGIRLNSISLGDLFSGIRLLSLFAGSEVLVDGGASIASQIGILSKKLR